MDYADGIRISDSERERLVDELGRHLTAGRLTIGEFDQRVGAVYRSVTTDERCLPEGSKRPRVCGWRFHNGRSLSPWWICH
uniref:DUF1707 SHOCT-like domain-containing protein n=1 Tax=Rhodococcus ruber TaxID=1830 RepID=UPI000A8F442A